MPHLKWFPALICLTLAAQTAFAQANRPFYSRENNFPRWEQLETGFDYRGTEMENGSNQSDRHSAAVYGRYGLLDDLALRVDVPFVEVDPAFGDSESGLGDLEVELQLRAYEDIFGYPYFIPWMNLTLPTGDEDDGLGRDEFIFSGGMAYGSKINDWIAWSLDVGYRVNPDQDNQLLVGHSYVWEVSDQFALLTEVFYEQEIQDGEDATVLLSGGFTYDWKPNLRMSIGVAGGLTGPTEVETNAKISYHF